MIQRIQTIYLFLIASIMLALLFLPMATLSLNDSGTYTFYATSNWALTLQIGVASFLSLLAIFCYKNRSLQLKLCSTLLAVILLICGSSYYFLIFKNQSVSESNSYSITLILPIIAIIFDILAMLAIRKDEKLIKSLNRIR